MITTSTTFVLGAGASNDYGLPLGSGLIQSIVGQLSVADRRHENIAGWIGMPKEILESFSQRLIDSDIRSIDAWLSRQTIDSRFPEIGRISIARAIHEHESSRVPSQGWYGILWNKMLEGCYTLKEFVEKNRVHFITFNYDRSLEYYLEKKVLSTFRDARENIRLLEELSPVHVHGRVGRLGWHSPVDGVEVEAPHGGLQGTTESNWKVAQKCLGYFRIVGQEDNASLAMTTSAKYVLQRSAQVYILGFGFHEENVQKLRMDGPAFRASVEAAVHRGSNRVDMQDYQVSSKSPLGKAIYVKEIENLTDYVDQVLRKLN